MFVTNKKKGDKRIMEKRTRYIDGLMMGAGIGDRCQVLKDGKWYLTSSVEDYIVLPGLVQIETQNTIYKTKEVCEAYSIWVDCGNYWVDCGLGNWLHFAPEEISSSRLNAWGDLEEIRTESKIFRLVERRLA